MHSFPSRLSALLIAAFGRDRLEYFCSNTYNSLTRRLNAFLWCFEPKALVLQRRQETPEVVSFELLPNQFWSAPRAGQFIELAYTVGGERLERAYSLSAIGKHTVWITVKRQGRMSQALHAQLRPGDVVPISGPFGHFVYAGQPALQFICAGTGITPCIALLEELQALPAAERPRLSLYAQFARRRDTLFAERLQRLQATGVNVELAYSREPAAGAPLLTAAPLGERWPELARQTVYLCGPAGFQQALTARLAAAGVSPQRLQIEHFSVQTASAPELEQLPEVTFRAAHCRIQMRPEDRHKTLLELGLEHGLNLEKGCRKGYCGSCKLVLHEGEVQGQTHGKAVYLCSAYAKSARVVLGT